jgi:hypothetical protein
MSEAVDMRFLMIPLFCAVCLLLAPTSSAAEGLMTDRFETQPETRWRLLTDTVMGGVSTGQVAFVQEDGRPHAHLTGMVSTKNNGGFIQIRADLPEAPPDSTTGVRLVVRGNDQRYFVHLRTAGTVLPWQYYQAGFEATGAWTEVRLPFASFNPSGQLLRSQPRAGGLKSIAIVAFGQDYQADIDIREIGFY